MKIIRCEFCNSIIEYGNEDIMLGGYPHIECPECGNMVALF